MIPKFQLREVILLIMYAPTSGAADCGGLIEYGAMPSGTITSPNHPDHYPNQTRCIWLLRGKDGWSVRLTITGMTGELSGTGECQDYLEVNFTSSA